MNFTDYLNSIYKSLDCTQTELCNASKLSASVISRYLSGEREPAADSEQLKALANGINEIAVSKGLTLEEYKEANLIAAFNDAINQKTIAYQVFAANFSNLIGELDINVKELASALNFDVSYLYRVKSGERRPVDLAHFCHLVSEYIASNKTSPEDKALASKLLGCDETVLADFSAYKESISRFLTTPNAASEEIPRMEGFLNKMETFNLDEYIKVIHFDELKVPSVPFRLPNSKYYYGVEDMRKAELDFLKATVLGKSMEDVTMCSYMPMQELADDMDFGKKWMFGIAMMIKKGLHLNVIHNLDRPINELMLGFEAWIPIYMTGQVSPYYIPDYSSKVFHQINYCSGSAALMGECIDGAYEDGRYYVTNNKTELSYFRKKTDELLKTAKPLMDVYTVADRDKFDAFFRKSHFVKGERRVISASLPEFTIPADLLDRCLLTLDPKKKDIILSYIKKVNAFAEEIMEDNLYTYYTSELDREAYEASPVTLCFPNIFSDFEYKLSYDEYMAHLKATKEYAATHKNFKLSYVDAMPFNNIKITIVKGKYFVISKAKTPNIHFVIYHKTMLHGMENFYVAYKE